MKLNNQHTNEKSRKRTGILVTVTLHAFMVVFFILFGFKVIDPKPGDIEVTWEVQGVENAGGENTETPTAETPQPDQENQETASASAQAADEQQLLSDQSSDQTIKSSPTNVKTPPKEVTNTKTPKEKTNDSEKEDGPSDALKRMTELLKKGKNNPGGLGDGTKSGQEGNEETDGNDHSGKKGAGNGKYDISGRTATNIGSQNNDCGVSGTVVIQITVNQQGVVTNALHVDGTTANQCLINQAKKFAKQIRYAPSNGGPKTNEGRITIKYNLS